MRASLRGNRSKQLIYTVRHNSCSSVSRSNSEKVSPCACVLVCVCVRGCLIGGEQAYRQGTEAFVVGYDLNVTETPPSVVKALIVTCVFK